MKLSGYVLAGGQSSRMGRDKSLLRIGEVTLLEIALHKLQQVCSDTSILCGSQEHGDQLTAHGRIVIDRVPDGGPLSGLDAALDDAHEEAVLLIAVDTPLLPVALLQQLTGINERSWPHEQGGSRGLQPPERNVQIERALAPAYSTRGVACFEVNGFVQPLPLLANRSARHEVKAAFTRGDLALLPLLRKLGLQTIAVEEASLFANVNTPEEFASVRETIQQNESRKGASE